MDDITAEIRFQTSKFFLCISIAKTCVWYAYFSMLQQSLKFYWGKEFQSKNRWTAVDFLLVEIFSWNAIDQVD